MDPDSTAAHPNTGDHLDPFSRPGDPHTGAHGDATDCNSPSDIGPYADSAQPHSQCLPVPANRSGPARSIASLSGLSKGTGLHRRSRAGCGGQSLGWGAAGLP
jgi:hypothetical protein